MPDIDVLLTLAPLDLPIRRDSRYDGGGFGIPLSAFAPEDQFLLQRVYAALTELCDLWQGTGEHRDSARLREAVLNFDGDAFVAEARALGEATIAAGEVGPLVHRVLHDVRGGGLHILIGTAALLRVGLEEDDPVRTCVSLARDHAKIMRSLITDIDPPVQEADKAHRPHSVLAYRDKWHGATIRVGGRDVKAGDGCTQRGDLCARASACQQAVGDRLDVRGFRVGFDRHGD